MRLRVLTVAFASAFATSGLVTTTAFAEPSKEDVAKADALFSEAQTLVQKGQFAEGCKKFAESQKLDPANGTALNLALCHEKDGKLATAYKELQELVGVMSNSKNPDDRERMRVASDRARQIDKKLTRIILDVTALPKDATIFLDGEKVEPAGPMPVDPGKHVVTASASQKKSRETPFETTGPGTMAVKLEALEDEAPPPKAAVATVPPKTAEHPEESTFWSGQRIAGAAIAGVGVVGLGVGFGFGADTFSKKSDRDAHCSGSLCDATGVSLNDDAHRSATISTVGVAVGIVAVIAGAYLFFTAEGSSPSKMTTAIAF